MQLHYCYVALSLLCTLPCLSMQFINESRTIEILDEVEFFSILSQAQRFNLYTENAEMKEIKKRKQEYECSDCLHKFNSTRDLKDHTKQMHGYVNKNICFCNRPGCNKRKFANSNLLRQHIKTFHLKKNLLTCHLCNRDLDGDNALQQHYRIVHKEYSVEDLMKCNQMIQSQLKEK